LKIKLKILEKKKIEKVEDKKIEKVEEIEDKAEDIKEKKKIV